MSSASGTAPSQAHRPSMLASRVVLGAPRAAAPFVASRRAAPRSVRAAATASAAMAKARPSRAARGASASAALRATRVLAAGSFAAGSARLMGHARILTRAGCAALRFAARSLATSCRTWCCSRAPPTTARPTRRAPTAQRVAPQPFQARKPDASTAPQLRLRDLFKGKKGILFAVPGAFTPGCSKARGQRRRGALQGTPNAGLRRPTAPADVASARQTHLPSYIADAEMLKKKGVEVVVCTATNDPCAPRAAHPRRRDRADALRCDAATSWRPGARSRTLPARS